MNLIAEQNKPFKVSKLDKRSETKIDENPQITEFITQESTDQDDEKYFLEIIILIVC